MATEELAVNAEGASEKGYQRAKINDQKNDEIEHTKVVLPPPLEGRLIGMEIVQVEGIAAAGQGGRNRCWTSRHRPPVHSCADINQHDQYGYSFLWTNRC